MLKKINKTIFFIMLIPSYLLLFISLMFFSMMHWKGLLLAFFFNIVGAWLLSFKKNLWINTLGVISILAFTYPLISAYQTPRIRPFWRMELRIGIIIIFISLLFYSYNIFKRVKLEKNHT